MAIDQIYQTVNSNVYMDVQNLFSLQRAVFDLEGWNMWYIDALARHMLLGPQFSLIVKTLRV